MEKFGRSRRMLMRVKLKVTVMTADGTRPVENALVRISYTGESGQTIEEVQDGFIRADTGPGCKNASAGVQHGAVGAAAICGIYGPGRSGRV